MNSAMRLVCLSGLVIFTLGVFTCEAQATDVTLESSEDCYAVGDTVYFTLSNHRDSTIYMPCLPPWSIWDASADTLVYPGTVFWVIVGLGPDSSETYGWSQIDYRLNQVTQGTYWVEVTYSRRLNPWNAAFTVVDTFYVGGASSLEVSTWGRVKALYR
jgi:hypothetical protein